MATAYEVTYIVRPNFEETEVDTKVEAIAEALRTSGAEVGEIEKMGKRRLAYEIDDMREGYYVVMKLTAMPPKRKSSSASSASTRTSCASS
ncbi:MAG: 30S ribosomal protein S6 [Candidatus Eremiobacteraeota bacterium]|nr:30S ribosomal protein S6 [Candidatus Eremiobacteraeota bacterium]